MALLIAVALAAIPIAYAAQSAQGAKEMRFACAKERGGELRYVVRARGCEDDERLIRFRRDDAVIVCARQGGNVYVVGRRRACRREPHAPSLVFVLADVKERHSFCAHERSGTLRSVEHVPYDPPRPRTLGGSPCKSSEQRVFVKKANKRPNARNDAATVEEASAAAIDVLANDRDRERRRLRIASVNAGSLRGTVTIAPDRRSITYDPSGRFEALGASASATETFSYRATDGRRRDRARVTVTVNGLNDGPNATADAGSTDENTATTLAVLSNDSDVDGGDVLSVSAVDTTGTAGTVTINPDGTVRYDPAGRLDALAPGQTRIDRLAYTISDGHGGSASATASVNVSGVNDAPAVNTSPGDTAYTEGGTAAVDPGLTVIDADDANLEGATVTIAAGFEAGDQLVFSDQNRIVGSVAGDTLTLTGTASKADYQTALRSVGFRHTGDDPASSRTVAFIVDDGDADSAAATKDLTITPVNDAPTVDTSGGSASFVEGGGPVAVDPGLTVADPDSAMLSGATIAITNLSTGDQLHFTNQNGITGSFNVATDVLTLAGTATLGQYEMALRSITYSNGLDDPATDTRTVRFIVIDGGGLPSTPDTRDVTVTPVNDAPVVAASAGATAYTEQAPETAIDTGLTVADADDANLEGATVTIATGFQPADELLFTDQAGITGSVAGDTLTLTGTASVAAYETALRSVRYRHNGDNPATAKTVTFTAGDGDAVSAPATKSISIAPINDAPALDTTDAALAYPENGGPVAADPGITVSDPDSTQLSEATVQITTSFVAAQDELAFANQLGITGDYDDSTGTLTLSGTTTVADYQAALRAVTYENGSDDPNPPARTLTFHATDAEGGSSAPATRDITLGAVNDQATITTTAGALAYTEDAFAATIDGGLTVADPDDANLEGARVSIGAGFDAGDELIFVNQLGISGVYDAGTGVLTLTGTSSVANYQTALRSIAFETTNDNPVLTKTVEFRADDGDGLGPASTRNIDVTRVNDAPAVAASAGVASFIEGGAVVVDPGVTVADSDSANLVGATVDIGTGHDAANDVLTFTDTAAITGSFNAATGTMTLTGAATVAQYQAALRDVRFDNGDQTPDTATRTVSFRVDDGSSVDNLSNVATRDVTVTAGGVYWTNSNTGTIGRANVDGTGANQSFITGASGPVGVAVAGRHVYWVNSGTFTIGRANRDGTGVNLRFIPGAFNSTPGAVAVDGTHVYWTNLGTDTIGRANLDGSGVNQSFITGADSPRGVAVDGTHVYWSNTDARAIGRANLDGSGANQRFIIDAFEPVGVAVDGTHVYWANAISNEIGRANLDGSGVNQSFITGATTPGGVAVDGTHVYWANLFGDTIGRANLDGSSANQGFISGASRPRGVAVDAG